MSAWRQELEYAAVGVAAAAVMELLNDRPRHASRVRVGRLLLAGGVAAVYAHLVPAPSWGLRSGAAFARSPLVSVAHARLHAPAPPLNLALWGALTGWGLHVLQLKPPADSAHGLVPI